MKTAEEIWQKFIALPGAVVGDLVGIASQQAIGGLISAIRRYRPRKILELGAGIGTLTYTVLETLSSPGYFQEGDSAFFTVENNEFCLNQLSTNLARFEKRYTIIPSTSAVPPGIQFDLVIVDGGGDLRGDMGVMDFGDMLAEKGVILIEGNRLFQRNCIQDWYGHRDYLYVKMPALNPKLVAKSSGKVGENKPYHLFIFEPELPERLRLQVQSLFCVGINKITRRLKFSPRK